MEKSQSHFFKYIGESLVIFCILLGVLIVAPAFSWAVILLPAPLVYISVKRGFFYGFLPFAMLASLMGLLLGWPGAVMFMALFAPPVLVISRVIMKKTRAFESVVFGAGSFALGIALVVGYIYLIAGTDLLTFLLNAIQGFMEKSNQWAYALLQVLSLQELLTGVKSLDAMLALPAADAIKEAMTAVRSLLTVLLPIAFSVFCLMGGLLNYVIARAVLKKKNTEVAPIPALSQFKLPKGFFAGMAFIAAVILAGSLLRLPGLDAVLNTSLTAYILVFSVCGLALIDFIMIRRNATKGTRMAVLIVVPVVGFLLTQEQIFYVLAIVGLLESVLKVRERIDKPDEFDGE